ncbi:hypothetical protein [Sorangium sp. So ce1000]|jgi:hypothetical protein|uniref:hypothetical protein n=1 Tax=Sorangium sp. So ce1000 TaxID=3133325 RepID=UPI003F626112
MARFFDTAGPCRPDLHYRVDPLRRIERLRRLIDRRDYKVTAGDEGQTANLLAARRTIDEWRKENAGRSSSKDELDAALGVERDRWEDPCLSDP